jgi:hypothetical protein
MPAPARQQPKPKAHQVWWDPEDWDGIEEATRILNERDHLDLNVTDIIRKGTRELVKRCRESILEERRDS